MTDLGRDTSCTTSLRTGRFSTGARLLAEADYRRLTTPRGTLRGGEEEKNYGLDLTEKIGSVATKSDAAALGGQIRSELMKDDRHDEVTVTVVRSVSGPAESWEVTIEGKSGAGPFSLVLLASAVTVELLGISA